MCHLLVMIISITLTWMIPSSSPIQSSSDWYDLASASRAIFSLAFFLVLAFSDLCCKLDSQSLCGFTSLSYERTYIIPSPFVEIDWTRVAQVTTVSVDMMCSARAHPEV